MVSLWNWLGVNVIILNLNSCTQAKIGQEPGSKKETEEIQFSKRLIAVKDKKIEVEIAVTPAEQQRGLMFRDHLDADKGMLFIFDEEQVLSFWMKNTRINLSIAYIGANKKIIDIQDMKARSQLETSEPVVYPSKGRAQFALEMNQGWYKKNGIKIGDSVDGLSK